MKPTEKNKSFEVSLSSYEDIILARQKVKSLMQAMGFSLLAQTRIVTAVSELARNVVIHAGRGTMSVYEMIKTNNTKGIKCIFEDQGPGIQDIEQALKEGFSTLKSLGLGLGGAKKLCNEFHIDSAPGKGTTVSISEWLR